MNQPFVLQSLAARVQVVAPRQLASRLRDLYRAGTGPAHTWVRIEAAGSGFLVSGRQQPERQPAQDEAHALELALVLLNRAAIEHAPGFAAHAGVVARGGRALCLPAVSGAGKSTLVAAALRAGCEYVSDEALVVDWATGSVLPYDKPLSLHAWTLDRLGLPAPAPGRHERALLPAELGSSRAAEPLVLAHIVFPDRAREPGLERVARGRAALQLLALSFNHFTRPTDSVRLVGEQVRAARCWRLGYDDPVAAASVLRKLLG